MLWRPSTSGEQLFLLFYEELADDLDVVGTSTVAADTWLTAHDRFVDFVKLTAAFEMFFRCLSLAKTIRALYAVEPTAATYAKELARDLELPRHIAINPKFAPLVRETVRIAATKKAGPLKFISEEPSYCYICGQPIAEADLSADHLWPERLGGETREENLMKAHRECNRKRDLATTWAFGPVQSTFYAHQTGINFEFQLRLSLGHARLMKVAAGDNPTGKRSSLKYAAQQLGPLFSYAPVLDEGRRYVYFELLKSAENLS